MNPTPASGWVYHPNELDLELSRQSGERVCSWSRTSSPQLPRTPFGRSSQIGLYWHDAACAASCTPLGSPEGDQKIPADPLSTEAPGQQARQHGAHADPASAASRLPRAESRTSQVCSQISCIRKLDFPVEASVFDASSSGNVLLARWCLHGVKKSWPKRQAWHLYC